MDGLRGVLQGRCGGLADRRDGPPEIMSPRPVLPVVPL